MRAIEYKVSYENMISRIPGLFAYLDSNELGEVSLHPAYDSNCGCYGKIVENIQLPSVGNKNFPNGISLNVDSNVLLEAGQTYTFRTIITYYYQYRDLLTKYVYETNERRTITVEEYRNLDARKQRLYKRQIESEFIEFVERGIGKIELPSDKYNEFVNNSNLYINICKDNNVITKDEYDELTDEEVKKNYRLKKNENVPKFIYLANVISLYNELVKMSKQCMFYQKNKENFGNDKHMCCLCEKYINMGGDGLRDYVGDLIDDYKNISTEYFKYAENAEKVKSMTLDLDIDLLSSYDDMGIMDSYVEEWLPYKQYYVGDRVFYEGRIWHYEKDNEGYFYEDALGGIWRCTVNNTGYYDEDEGKVVFSDRYFEKIKNVFEKIDIQYQNIEDEKDVIADEDYQKQYNALESDEQKTEFKSKYKLYSPQSLKPITKNTENTFKITGQTDSKLKDLRRFVTYMNDDNIGEKPQNGYDWLFYYRIGNICNISTLNDDLGNILKLDGKTTAGEGDGSNLMAYGDVITDIKANNEENTITFEYIINAHLTSKTHSSKLDEDKNTIHYWKDFEPEENTGVKYTETYNYAEDSDLDKLINGEFKLGIKTEDGKVVLVLYLDEEEIEVNIKEWKSTTEYHRGDIVSHDGSIWRCKVDNKEEEFNTDYFEKVVEELEIKEWESGKEYHRGDRVFHENSIWRCTVNNTDQTDFNTDYFEELEIKKWEKNKQYYRCDRVIYDGSIWRCIENNTEQDVFSEEYFKRVEIEQWIPKKQYYVGDRVFYNGRIWHCTGDNTGIVFSKDYFEEVEKIEEWKANKQYYKDDRVFYVDHIWRCIKNDSTGRDVFSEDYFEKVEEIKEWIAGKQYYRGNRVFYKGSIWRCTESNTGRVVFSEDYFKRVEIEEWETDKEYHRGDKVFHENSIYRCIKDDNTGQAVFSEDYFEKVVEEEFTFENYVKGKYDDNLKSFKFEFITFNNELSYNKTIANQEVNIVSTLTDFEVFKNDNDEFMEVHSMADDKLDNEGIHMFRHDYFNGVTYAPTKKIDARIERGSTSCFQQHIGFSEIKTLNDLVEHGNGSFFKINEG